MPWRRKGRRIINYPEYSKLGLIMFNHNGFRREVNTFDNETVP